MNIDSIVNGIVIDHITAGKGMEIYNLLNLGKLPCMVALINNASSEKMGRKDIIKIDAAIELDTGHVQNVQRRHGRLQIGGFHIGDVLLVHGFLHIIGNLQLLGGDQDELHTLVTAHGIDQGVNGAAEL